MSVVTNEWEECDIFSNITIDECLKLNKKAIVIYDGDSDLDKEALIYIKNTNDIPKFKFDSLACMKQMTLSNKVSIMTSSAIHGMTWQDIRVICEKQEIPFRNQTIGNLLNQLMHKFYDVERIQFTKLERDDIQNKQMSKCNMCFELLGKSFHIDHIRPLANGGNNEKNNLQALCISCHIEKSREEKASCEYIQVLNFKSAFNLQANEAIQSKFFLKVAFTQQLPTYGDEYGLEKFSIDMNKCRRNILLHSGFAFCAYSVLDNIEPFAGEIMDGFYYLESDNVFPLRGNGFYSKPMIEYCLKKEIITTDNIKLQLLPSTLIKSDYFHGLVDFLIEAFDKNSKLSINALIGLFGRRDNSYIDYKICNKNSVDDIACCFSEMKKPYMQEMNEDLMLLTSKKDIKMVENYFPIHAQILDCEAIELHKLVNTITSRGGIPYCVKTDAVQYYANTAIDLSNLFWDTNKTIPLCKQEFNFNDLQRPVNIVITDKYVLEPTVYSSYNECEFDEMAEQIIKENKGCFIPGAAGTGKTYLTNHIISKLDEKRILRLAPTNVSAILIKGETIDKFAHTILATKNYRRIKNIDYIFIDEISMVKEIFYQLFIALKLHKPSLKFIISGDFDQLPPVKDKVKDGKYDISRALNELVDGRILRLTKCKRSDDILFNICDTIKQGKDVDITQFKSNEKSYLNLSFTNKTRKQINNECMLRFISGKNVPLFEVKKLSYDDNTQDFYLAAGMPIISRVNMKSLDVVNNEMFFVSKIGKDTIEIFNTNKNLSIEKNKFNKLFLLSFCITVHKSQGATFNEKYVIHEWRKFDKRLKYVAMSRSSNINNIIIN